MRLENFRKHEKIIVKREREIGLISSIRLLS